MAQNLPPESWMECIISPPTTFQYAKVAMLYVISAAAGVPDWTPNTNGPRKTFTPRRGSGLLAGSLFEHYYVLFVFSFDNTPYIHKKEATVYATGLSLTDQSMDLWRGDNTLTSSLGYQIMRPGVVKCTAHDNHRTEATPLYVHIPSLPFQFR